MYTTPLYCTSALYAYGHTVSTNESRLRSPNSRYDGFRQQDAHEFLCECLDSLEEEVGTMADKFLFSRACVEALNSRNEGFGGEGVMTKKEFIRHCPSEEVTATYAAGILTAAPMLPGGGAPTTAEATAAAGGGGGGGGARQSGPGLAAEPECAAPAEPKGVRASLFSPPGLVTPAQTLAGPPRSPATTVGGAARIASKYFTNNKRKEAPPEDDGEAEGHAAQSEAAPREVGGGGMTTAVPLHRTLCPTRRNFTTAVAVTLRCEECGDETVRYETFRHLSLEIPLERHAGDAGGCEGDDEGFGRGVDMHRLLKGFFGAER